MGKKKSPKDAPSFSIKPCRCTGWRLLKTVQLELFDFLLKLNHTSQPPPYFMQHVTRTFLTVFAFASATLASAQCENVQACNYDPAGTDPCNFSASNQDFSAGVLLGIPFAQYGLDTTANCAVQPINDQLVQMAPNTEGYLQFVIDDAVFAYFEAAVASGQVTQEQADQFLGLMTYATFAFCGDDMTVNLPGLGTVEDTFENGYWFLGEMIGYYVAPAANSPIGCGDPDADNFDVCAISDESLCTYPPVACEDPLACNYEEGSIGTDECIYFDTDNFALGANDFIGLFEVEDCESGYAGWNDLPMPLGAGADGGPLFFTILPGVDAILIQFGFETLLNDLSTAAVSVCGDTMNYISTLEGDLDLIWDGHGFPNPIYGGYIAPGTSFPIGCPDPNACNFDACSHPFANDACEYVEPGTVVGDSIVAQGGTYTYTYEGGAEGSTFVFYTACGEVEQDGSNTATLTFDFPGDDCEMCVEETTLDDCSTITCLTLTPDGTNLVESSEASWSIMPNPALDEVTINWSGEAVEWVVLDATGREVQRTRVFAGMTRLNVSSLAAGTYLIGPAHGLKHQLQIVR